MISCNIHNTSSIVMKVKVLVPQSCPTLCNPWTVAHQASLSMGISRQEYWSGLPSPSPSHVHFRCTFAVYIVELSNCFYNSGKSTDESLEIIALSSPFQKAQDYGYDQSMMARFHKLLEESVEHNMIGRLPVLQLTIQYRMHPDICLFPSSYIYDGILRTNRWVLLIAC